MERCTNYFVFILELDDNLFKDLSRRLKEANVQDYVKNLKDMYIDFIGKQQDQIYDTTGWLTTIYSP